MCNKLKMFRYFLLHSTKFYSQSILTSLSLEKFHLVKNSNDFAIFIVLIGVFVPKWSIRIYYPN